MKQYGAIQTRLTSLRTQLKTLEGHIVWLMANQRHADAAKTIQRKAALEDQIELLEWVLKP